MVCEGDRLDTLINELIPGAPLIASGSINGAHMEVRKEYARCVGNTHGVSPTKSDMMKALVKQRQSKDHLLAMLAKGGKSVAETSVAQKKSMVLVKQIKKLRRSMHLFNRRRK